jgi:hypothetical protein
MLGSVLDPLESAPLSAQTPLALPEPIPGPAPITIRLLGQGLHANKFTTQCVPGRILDAVDEMLYSLGLDCDEGGFVSGRLLHPQAWVCTITVEGTARKRKQQAEFVIDLSWRSSMTAAAILLAIFLFPVGLILALVFSQMGQSDVKRIIDDAFRSLRNDLAVD